MRFPGGTSRTAKCLNNIYIKSLGLPVCSIFHEPITGHLVRYYTPLNIPSTESDRSFISGNHYPDRDNTGPPQRHTLDWSPAAMLDLPWACGGVGWCSEPDQCPICVIYVSVSLIYLPCLKVFFFTEILHNAGVQEVCGKMHLQELYRNIRKQTDF